MRSKEWDWNSHDLNTHEHGDYWPIRDDNYTLIGFVIICPFEIIPDICHRHWYLFTDYDEESWVYVNESLLDSPSLECPNTKRVYKVVSGDIEYA